MRYTTLLFIWTILLSCDTKQREHEESKDDSLKVATTTSENINQIIADSDSVLIPPFEIEVVLSDKAKERMDNPKETIIVLVEFIGEPADTVIDRGDDNGPFILRSIEREISKPWTLKVENIKMSKKIFNKLPDKNYQVSAQIWTGRHSSEFNLLNGGLVYGTIEEIKNKKHLINAGLIRE
jgi:hypothetical protein